MEGYIWDYRDPYAWKVREGLPPLIISVAITGGVKGDEREPARDAGGAGEQTRRFTRPAPASCTHARNPEVQWMTTSNPRTTQVNAMIRPRPDIIINNTTGGGRATTSSAWPPSTPTRTCPQPRALCSRSR